MELVHADDVYTSMVAAEPTDPPFCMGDPMFDMLPDIVGVGGSSELDPATRSWRSGTVVLIRTQQRTSA